MQNSPLRQQFIDHLTLRAYSLHTVRSYVGAVRRIAVCTKRPLLLMKTTRIREAREMHSCDFGSSCWYWARFPRMCGLFGRTSGAATSSRSGPPTDFSGEFGTSPMNRPFPFPAKQACRMIHPRQYRWCMLCTHSTIND